MKIQRNYIYTALLCAAFITAGFFGGYYSGRMIYKDKTDTQPNVSEKTEIQSFHSAPTEEAEATPAETVTQVYYLLTSEDSSLRLYEISGNSKVMIKNIRFNSEFVPAEDRRRLESGIKLSTKEEGFGLIEDFTS